MKQEYVIMVENAGDLAEIEQSLSVRTNGVPFIPDSECAPCKDISSAYIGNWMLTEEEADQLSNHPKIELVSKPEKPKLIADGIQTGNFSRGDITASPVLTNYGLQRSSMTSNLYNGNSVLNTPNYPEGDPDEYPYSLDGTGVDIVIIDSGIDVNHPEFFNEAGVSRIQQIDWTDSNHGNLGAGFPDLPAGFYTDVDGHGTSCASLAGGICHGWAKNANIYVMTVLNNAGNEYDIYDGMLAITRWHQNKNNPNHAGYTGRPTILSCSWSVGIFGQPYENITGGEYKGEAWDRAGLSDIDMATQYRLPELQNYYFVLGSTEDDFPVLNRRFREASEAGIHILKSSGNFLQMATRPGHEDYDNYVIHKDDPSDTEDEGIITYTHRVGVPYTDQMILCGNIEPEGDYGPTNNLEQARICVTGPAIDVYAPGANCMAATINRGRFTEVPYQLEPQSLHRQRFFGGTSASCPNTAGVLALHLQSNPNLTPSEARQRIINDSNPGLHDRDTAENLVIEGGLSSGFDRVMFSRYSRPSLKVDGTFTGDIKGISIED